MDTSAPYRLRLRASPDAARRAREALTRFCEDLNELEVAEVMLLTSELVSNAIVHPRRPAPGGAGEIELVVERRSSGLRVEVRDLDAESMPTVVRPESPPSESGMGLRVVQMLATDWGSHVLPGDAGKAVWFEYATSDQNWHR